MSDAIGVFGILIFFAGLYLLWKAQDDVLSWIEEYIHLLQAHIRSRTDPEHAPVLLEKRAPGKKNTFRIVLGLALAFFLAPFLITLGLALRW